jgi:hypothetical protein
MIADVHTEPHKNKGNAGVLPPQALSIALDGMHIAKSSDINVTSSVAEFFQSTV